jgi:hypothetical protein
VKAAHNLAALAIKFDEDNLVPNAGLAAPAALAQRLGIAELVDERVRPRIAPERPTRARRR